jgi:apocytochrome f
VESEKAVVVVNLKRSKFPMKKFLALTVSMLGLFAASSAQAYPQFAANYKEARDASGRIACANCHLASKDTEVELPQTILPGQVFEAKIKVPYDNKAQEVYADGSKGPLQVGAILIMPKGFRLAEGKEIPKELAEKIEKGVLPSAAPIADDKPYELLVGPHPGTDLPDKEIVIPVKAPDPGVDKKVNFGKYSFYFGGNRGRGQVYPTGTSSNNAVFTAKAEGTIANIQKDVKVTLGTGEGATDYEKGALITIKTKEGKEDVEKIPPGPELKVKVGDAVKVGDPLTTDPNVGGYGQAERDIVLQDPQRVVWLLVALGAAFLCQLLLVLKKKQVEKVQEYEAQQQGL